MSASNLLRFFHNFAYCLCLCPFRIVKISTENSVHLDKVFIATSILPQKILCLISTVFITFWLWVDIKLSHAAISEGHEATLFFHFASEVFSSLFNILTLYSFWFGKHETADIVNSIEKAHSTTPNLLGKWSVSVICVIPLVLSGWFIFAGVHDTQPGYTSYFHIWAAQIVETIRFGLFLGNGTVNPIAVNDSEFLNHHPMWTVVGVLSFVQRKIIGVYGDFQMLIVTMTLWVVTKNFIQSLSSTNSDDPEHPEPSWVNVKPSYMALQSISEKINKAYGSKLAYFLLSIVVYCSTRLDATLHKSNGVLDSFRRLAWMTYIINACIMFYFSTDICRQVEIQD